MAGHTPGPWTIVHGANGDCIVTTNEPSDDGISDDVCHVYGGNRADDTQAMADARLIAATPDLLEELQHVLFCIETSDSDGAQELADRIRDSEEGIRSVIARATGAPA